MNNRTGKELLQEKLPISKNSSKFLAIGFIQLLFFIILLFILLKITSYNWRLSIIGEIIVSFFAILPYAYVTINNEKLRRKYREKYGNLAFQKIWFRFLSYNEPLSATGLFFPFLLKTNYFLPVFIELPACFFTRSLFNVFVAVPLSVFLIVLGSLIRRPTGGYDSDIGSYMYLIFPEDSRKLEGGLYSFIRHPNYLGRGIIALGIGVFANNILAISLCLIHFSFFYILSLIEDWELVNRFGVDFIEYKKMVPAMIPRFRNWKIFLKMIFFDNKKT